jgi:hypothetical protein
MHRTHAEPDLNNPLQIQYRDFYDVPRMFVVVHDGSQYLFEGSFDDQLDDYPDEYRVFLLPNLTQDQLSGSWTDLTQRASRLVGKIPTRDVTFDRTKRQAIDASIFDRLGTMRQ